MTLRTRLLLGDGLLIVVLLASVLGAALTFHRLAQGIEIILADNVTSVRIAARLLELLERYHAGVFHGLSGGGEEEPRWVDTESEFLQALAQAKSTVAVVGELELVNDVEESFARCASASSRLLAAPGIDPLATYEEEVAPACAQCAATLGELIDLNIEAIRVADRDARQLARQAGTALAILAAAALVLLGLVSRQLHRHLLDPLEALRDAAATIAAADGRCPLPVWGDKELRELATQLNAALMAREEAVARTGGLLAQQRQLLLGLLASLPEPVALVGLDGQVVASTFTDDETEVLTRSQAAFRTARTERDTTPKAAPRALRLANGQFVRLQPLVAPPDRAVGWLVQKG